MDQVTIQLNGKTFMLTFGMKVLRLLGKKWNVPGVNGVFAKLAVVENTADELAFEQIDIVNDFMLAAIEANESNTETITVDELDELILKDTKGYTETFQKVFQGFIESMPKPEGKPKAPKANRKPGAAN